jgi:hypothetical protein
VLSSCVSAQLFTSLLVCHVSRIMSHVSCTKHVDRPVSVSYPVTDEGRVLKRLFFFMNRK